MIPYGLNKPRKTQKIMGFEGKNRRKDTKKAVTSECDCLIFSGATRNRNLFPSG